MKISSTVFKSGEKNIKGSNVCCGNIKILNTELLVEGKISNTVFKSGGKNIKNQISVAGISKYQTQNY